MAPTPPAPFREVCPIHLRCYDLSKPGSIRFFTSIPDPYSILHQSVLTVLKSLYPDTLIAPTDLVSRMTGAYVGPKPIRSVTIYLREFDGVEHTKGSELDEQHKEIHLSTLYLEKPLTQFWPFHPVRYRDDQVDPKRLRHEIEGVLVHELVHVYQHDAGGSCNGGLIEGMADWVRLGAGLGPPHWRMGGDRWDQGYETTAFFLAFLAKYLDDDLFVPKLNMALKGASWNDGEVLKKQLGGRDVEELWKVYKRTVVDNKEKEDSPPAPVPTHRA